MIENIDNKIGELVNEVGTNEAITFVKNIINHCLLALNGLYVHKGHKNYAKKVLEDGLPFAQDSRLYAAMSVVLIREDKLEEAVLLLENAIKDYPADAFTYFNYGFALRGLGRLDEAIAALEKSCELNPKAKDSHGMLADLYAATGNYERYFEEDWFKFTVSPFKNYIAKYKKPIWDGSDVRDKALLIINEQGSGDLIQFSRYAKLLKEKTQAKILLGVTSTLKDLFKSLEGVDELFVFDPVPYNLDSDFRSISECLNPVLDISKYDYIVPVAMIPYYFDAALKEIPLDNSYLSTNLVQSLPAQSLGRRKIGICWAGNYLHSNDCQRTCHLKHFKPLFENPNIEIFSFQVGNNVRSWYKNKVYPSFPDGTEEYVDVNLLEETEEFRYHDLSSDLTDYNITASYLKSMDLLISIDTGVAHLAGALGVPVWLLLPNKWEWRWRKIWYPSMKYFQQSSMGDWEGLLRQVAVELENYPWKD